MNNYTKILGIIIAYLMNSPFALAGSEPESHSHVLENDKPYTYQNELDRPTVLAIENHGGDVIVKPSQDGKFSVEAKSEGYDKGDVLKLEVSTPENGKMRIKTHSPSNAMSGNTIQMGKMTIHGMSSSGPVFSGKNITIVNGKIISGDLTPATSLKNKNVSLIVNIPPQHLSHVQVETTNGNAHIKDFDDSQSNPNRIVSLKSKNGNLSATHVIAKGGLNMNTKNGNSIVTHSHGEITAETHNGNITAEQNFGGNLNALTHNGTLRISNHDDGHVKATSHNGNIHLNNPKALSETTQTHNGKVFGKTQSSAHEGNAKTSPFNF